MVEDLRTGIVFLTLGQRRTWRRIKFLDNFGGISDYLAITNNIDVRGHNSSVYYHLIFTPKYENSGNGRFEILNASSCNITTLHCG